MKYSLLFILLLFSATVFSQTFTYKGIATDNGQPLTAASVCIKGTSTCVYTDRDGNYSIVVNIGDELVINYIGMKPQYVKITGTGSQPISMQLVAPVLSSDFSEALRERDTLAATEPSGTTNSYSSYHYAFNNVVKVEKDKNNVYSFKTTGDYHRLYLKLFSESTFGEPIRLRSYQKTYAQGRSIGGAPTYQAPETNEIFSWGPAISSLQTSGNATPYYPNGEIIPGTGNAVPLFNPNRFYNNTFQQKTGFSARLLMPTGHFFDLDFTYRDAKDAIPTAKNDELSTTFSYDARLRSHHLKARANFNRFENDLSNSNFIYNKAIYANAITPAHFDNNAGATLANGLPRSFSTLENNPDYLLSYNRDAARSNALGLLFSDEYSYDNIKNTLNLTAQFADNEITGGNLPNAAQVSTADYNRRKEKYSMISLQDEFTLNYPVKSGARLNARYQQRDLTRNFYEGFSSLSDYPGTYDSSYTVARKQDRTEVNLNLNAEHTFWDVFDWYGDALRLFASTDFSYSSTYKDNVYTGYRAGFDWNGIIINKLSLFGSVASRRYEPDLQLNNLNFNSLSYRVDEFKALRNNLELFAPNVTSLTRETTYTAGARYFGRVQLDLELYKKNVTGMYVPLQTGNAFSWAPGVDYEQQGLEFTATYKKHSDRFSFNHNFNFTTYKNKVTGLTQNRSRIAYAGFEDVNKNYVLNQPLGVIMGSVYKRDAYNNVVIGADGFPLVAAEPAVVGDPNPDFIVGYAPEITFRRFTLNLGFDWSHGGDLWNGTNQTLNYYGVSNETAQQRNVTGYVFNGVTQSGQPNTQPVSFYDATQPVSQNRWVRYGVGGVAEDAIESAGYFRLANVTASYNFNINYGKDTFNLRLSAFVNNLFIVSESGTAFAGNALFNSSETSGLDYFNSPLLRTYGLTVDVKF